MKKESPESVSISPEELSQYVERVSKMGIHFADLYLDEKDPLREYIIEYYSDADRLQSELQNVFRNMKPDAIDAHIRSIEQRFSNKTEFIELFERIQEKNDVFKRERKRFEEHPEATDEEYEAGAYREVIERQVVDAVFNLRAKGYDTFQSGFSESKPRTQFIDVYNKKVTVPETLVTRLRDAGFEVRILKSDDRATIELHPLQEDAVRLSEWKKVWDTFASEMPKVEAEDMSRIKMYGLKKRFREFQDSLKKAA